ncbi:MAG: gamma carbonic anhydrase family protein [Planctomycetota bacterium]|nr:MAG: gamma carbonic anhydrase family protein [Planctomycetota bacterium]
MSLPALACARVYGPAGGRGCWAPRRVRAPLPSKPPCSLAPPAGFCRRLIGPQAADRGERSEGKPVGLYEIGTRHPSVPPEVYLAPGSQVVGEVTIGPESSVWFNAVVRGDVLPVRIGSRTNVQDLAMVHVTTNRFPCTIGDEVTVGHGAVLHGCRVADRVLIGMGAILLDGAEIGEGSIVAAQSLVRVGFKVPPGTLVAGVPAQVKRALSSAEREQIVASAQRYVKMAQHYRTHLRAAQFRPAPPPT